MGSRLHYRDFDLWIDEVGGGFLARAKWGNLGGRSEIDLSAWLGPFPESGPQDAVQPWQDGSDKVAAQAKFVGDKLFRHVFRPRLRECWHLARGSVKEDEGLRIRLHLGSARLACVPWELMRDLEGRDSLGVSSQFPISRYLDQRKPVGSPAPFPVGILVCDSVPDPRPDLHVQEEVKAITSSWNPLRKKGQVVVDRLRDATFEQILDKLREGKWHILHFIGHGSSKGLRFRTSDGGERLVGRRDWSVVGQNAKPLRLVVLNCCDSAASSPGELFSSVAEELSRAGVPAVVGMRSLIEDRSAVIFAQWFYKDLAEGRPVDTAAASARRALFHQAGHRCFKPDPPDSIWSTPVVYLSVQDGHVIDWASRENRALEDVAPPGSAQEPDILEGGLGHLGYSPALGTLTLIAFLAFSAYLAWDGFGWIGDGGIIDPGNLLEATTTRGAPNSGLPAPHPFTTTSSKSGYLALPLFQDTSLAPPLFAYCMKDVDPDFGQRLAEEHRQGEVIVYQECLKYARTEPALVYRYGKLETRRPSLKRTAGRDAIQEWLDAHNGDRTAAFCWDGSTSNATGRGACSHHGGVMIWQYKQRNAALTMAEICIDRTLVSTASGGCGPGGNWIKIPNHGYHQRP
ncbi:MAG TPA: CHAT domain-containing protein [Acidobacteriota bacterium]|nr:CHAT domain-containing protein [Acidobacteriota bacterium]